MVNNIGLGKYNIYLADTEELSGIFAIALSEVWRDESSNPSPGTAPPSDSWYYRIKERGQKFQLFVQHQPQISSTRLLYVLVLHIAVILLTVNPTLKGNTKWW